ncbi:MAG: glycoside hydrolase family 2 protein [Oscillospiraceae bacterium]|nr:glycoside hydrolase family 2 protein [Oscillospiraceae bacterium]
MRTVINFNDNWLFSFPGEEPAAVTLPHTWNALDGQDGGNDYRRGIATYEKSFSMPDLLPGERCFIELNGAAMSADLSLNGVALVHHDGGYSTFRADITEYLKKENLLHIEVDNSKNERVYPQMADFTFYGGLYRDVNLIIVPAEHFELVADGSRGIKITPSVDLAAKRATVTIETWHNSECVYITVNGETQCVKNTAVFTIENVRLWNGLDDPYLYTAYARLSSGDEVCARFGCREFHIDPEKGFFLNGRSYPLRGVSRHQDRKGLGNALSMKEHCEDMEIIREIGANTLRLAHYQHAEEFYDLCDENGLIVWAEIPYITKHMSGGRENAISQMRELITQCYNHPSIVCWGLSNEITASGTVTDELISDHKALNELCHRMDPTRPTVMAHAFMLEKDSPLIPVADIASYNLYFGWYLGNLEQNDEFFDEYHSLYPDRIIGFSEYGADANIRFHSSAPEKGDYTEEYQCLYHEHILKLIDERPYLWATHVWNLFDFAADGRDEGGKRGENQKGLVEFDRKTKKDAFYLYKAAWSKEPFVHICGSRYADRCENITEIKVYSNLPEITLFVDGRKFETKRGERVFTFRVPISGKHRISAGEDEIVIRRVYEPNRDYIFRKQAVINWFDAADYDPSCYSIKDTMGALKSNPQTAAILERLMERLTASRGDVAKAAHGNANLEKMMAGLSLESLIKQAGDSVPGEMIRSLNASLQRIKK